MCMCAHMFVCPVDDVVDESDDNEEIDADTENDTENEDDEKDLYAAVILSSHMHTTYFTSCNCCSKYSVYFLCKTLVSETDICNILTSQLNFTKGHNV